MMYIHHRSHASTHKWMVHALMSADSDERCTDSDERCTDSDERCSLQIILPLHHQITYMNAPGASNFLHPKLYITVPKSVSM